MLIDGYVKADGDTMALGIRWEVGHQGEGLVIAAGGSLIVLNGEHRDRFAEAVARSVMPGVRVKHGPGCGCTPCKAEPSYEAARAAGTERQ